MAESNRRPISAHGSSMQVPKKLTQCRCCEESGGQFHASCHGPPSPHLDPESEEEGRLTRAFNANIGLPTSTSGA